MNKNNINHLEIFNELIQNIGGVSWNLNNFDGYHDIISKTYTDKEKLDIINFLLNTDYFTENIFQFSYYLEKHYNEKDINYFINISKEKLKYIPLKNPPMSPLTITANKYRNLLKSKENEEFFTIKINNNNILSKYIGKSFLSFSGNGMLIDEIGPVFFSFFEENNLDLISNIFMSNDFSVTVTSPTKYKELIKDIKFQDELFLYFDKILGKRLRFDDYKNIDMEQLDKAFLDFCLTYKEKFFLEKNITNLNVSSSTIKI